jgi:hypothetical protein
MQNRTFGPYLTAINKIFILVMVGRYRDVDAAGMGEVVGRLEIRENQGGF